jgi:hypothetical protein
VKAWVLRSLAGLASGSAFVACIPLPIFGEDSGTETGEVDDPYTETITHSFGERHLAAFEEDSLCASWKLDNEEPVYVNAVTLMNSGAWHHSNWFVVPQGKYKGDDGYWRCSDRGFEEIDAARSGTVLYAQSTQAWLEVQQLNEGAVVKIPPRHTVVGGVHALNLSARAIDTELRMSLDLIHPKDVDIVLTPMRLSYLDLEIPPQMHSRFSSDCDMSTIYGNLAGKPLDLKIHYVLPHYHSLGDFFELAVLGGPRDGEVIYQLDGFNAEANGFTFSEPVDLSGANGLSFTCGYDNWTDQEVGWGIGDQEMCVMLGLVEGDLLMENTVLDGSAVVDANGDTVFYEANCLELAFSKNAKQGPPTEEEIEGDLYVPPVDPDDQGLPPVPECEDVDPGVPPYGDVSLSAIRDEVFIPTCTFSSCHGQSGQAAGLNLTAGDLHSQLLNHDVRDTAMPLVDPGDPDNSWLWHALATCEPETPEGDARSHMPRNAPVLLDAEIVTKVRAWIQAGAPDN